MSWGFRDRAMQECCSVLGSDVSQPLGLFGNIQTVPKDRLTQKNVIHNIYVVVCIFSGTKIDLLGMLNKC